MNKKEAREVLDAELAPFKAMSHAELAGKIGVYCTERIGASGQAYQVEIEVFWENKRKRVIRVCASSDESPHKPVFYHIPVLRWLPLYVSSVTWTFAVTPGQEKPER